MVFTERQNLQLITAIFYVWRPFSIDFIPVHVVTRQSASVSNAAGGLELKNPAYIKRSFFPFSHFGSISSRSVKAENVICTTIRTEMLASQGQNPRKLYFSPTFRKRKILIRVPVCFPLETAETECLILLC